MKRKYSKLRGRIRECGITQEELADKLGMNSSTLSLKLNGKYGFSESEIESICSHLRIELSHISDYFFCK